MVKRPSGFQGLVLAMSRNLKILSEVIGVDAACKLAEVAPASGKNKWIYIPHNPDPESFISKTIGYSLMATLCNAMGGTQFTVGNPDRFRRMEKFKAGVRAGKRIGALRVWLNVPSSAAYRAATEARSRMAATHA